MSEQAKEGRSEVSPMRLYQCPGCWSFGSHSVPDGGWLECDCGERMTRVDLREPEDDSLADLPPNLARVLRDQSIIVPQDAAVFEAIAKWSNAPSNTASAD